jgi:hypothetical protein
VVRPAAGSMCPTQRRWYRSCNSPPPPARPLAALPTRFVVEEKQRVPSSSLMSHHPETLSGATLEVPKKEKRRKKRNSPSSRFDLLLVHSRSPAHDHEHEHEAMACESQCSQTASGCLASLRFLFVAGWWAGGWLTRRGRGMVAGARCAMGVCVCRKIVVVWSYREVVKKEVANGSTGRESTRGARKRGDTFRAFRVRRERVREGGDVVLADKESPPRRDLIPRGPIIFTHVGQTRSNQRFPSSNARRVSFLPPSFSSSWTSSTTDQTIVFISVIAVQLHRLKKPQVHSVQC